MNRSFCATDSEISGISSVEIACKLEEMIALEELIEKEREEARAALDFYNQPHTDEEWKEHAKKEMLESGCPEEDLEKYFYYDSESHEYCKNEEGKKIIGIAIPFNNPKVSSPLVSSPEYADKHFGTIKFSAVLSPLVRYLPAVIGAAILSIAVVIPPFILELPSFVVKVFLHFLQLITNIKQLKLSAMVSARRTK